MPESVQPSKVAPRRRQLTRSMSVDLESVARSVLMQRWMSNEDLLEIYRWIAVTAEERGRRWRSSDSWEHRRYPGIRGEFGLRRWSTYPTNEDGFGLCFVMGSSEYMPKVREVIVLAAFGDGPNLTRWRKANGLRRCTVPCRILGRAGGRRIDPLREVFFARPSRFVPHVDLPARLNVSFNSGDRRSRSLFAFVLMPTAEGWRLEVEFGQRSRERGGVWAAWRTHAGKCLGGPPQAIPVQRLNESANEFFERACEYARSVVVATTKAAG